MWVVLATIHSRIFAFLSPVKKVNIEIYKTNFVFGSVWV
jgi:hypothetical protein